jgi:hypothetical protein
MQRIEDTSPLYGFVVSIPTAPTKSPVESVAFATREPQIGAVGMLGNLLHLRSGNARLVPLKSKIPGFDLKKRKRPFRLYLGPLGPSGQGRTRRLQL